MVSRPAQHYRAWPSDCRRRRRCRHRRRLPPADRPPATPTSPCLQAAPALEALVAARIAPTSQQARLLLGLVQQPAAADHAALLPALALLARWARRQALQPAATRDAPLVREVAAAATQLLPAGGGQPRRAAACVLLLSSLGAAASDPRQADELAAAVGGALLGPQLGPPEPHTAAEAAAAVGVLLPCLLVSWRCSS